jgi:cation transporter-like permease
MNSTHWNGSHPSCDRPVISLAVYRAQRRRAALAAQAAARRRTVVCLALCLLGLVAGAVARELDSRVQVVEVRQ